MFRSWFNTPITIDTKPLAAKNDMAIDTTARNQGEKLFNTITTNPMITTANANTMTMMVSPKVLPTVKSTSVNVNMDDQINNVNNDSALSSEFDAEPLRSASISLSIELAKKTSYSSLNSPSSVNTTASKPIFMQKPDNITPQSSLPKHITKHSQQQERPSSIASHSSNSLLQRMAHSPKAAPATFSTSVSANGKNNSHQDSNESNNKSAVIESLSKKINPPVAATEDMDELTEEDIHNVATNTTTPTVSMNTTDDEDDIDNQQESQQQQKLDSSQSSTCENSLPEPSAIDQEKGDQKVSGFWSWLGFPSSDNDL
ncbi:hypothetical protein G6F42_022211 [Rhizopus arrhizus]|nr:hypothetical protein G6F42_022211 [Rhizopus arrhizus]